MSGSVLTYSPASKTFIPRGSDGKFSPKGPVKLTQQGVSQPQHSQNMTILTQKPANRP